jgi:hypothetical protein
MLKLSVLRIQRMINPEAARSLCQGSDNIDIAFKLTG